MVVGRTGRARRNILAIPAILVLTLAACGAAGSAARLSGVGDESREGPSAAPAASGGAAADSNAAGGDGGGEEQPPAALRDEARVVYTGSLQLIVDDVDGAVVTGSGIVRGAGGYIGASERTSDGDNPVATITYRIPADRWETVVDQLRGVATKVAGEQTSAVEVTGQIVDMEARIRNLRASEAALQTILSRAERIADVLEVQRELTTVRGEIERLDAQRAALEDQAAYGTLAVTYGMELFAVVEAAREWDPASEVDQAVGSLLSVLQGLATLAIWFAIVWLPILLFVGAAVAVVAVAVRRVGSLRHQPSSPNLQG